MSADGDRGDDAGGVAGLSVAELAAAMEAYYPRLRGLVRDQLARLSGRHPDSLTDPPTACAHDLYMDLLNQRMAFRDADHMMAVASARCVQILVDSLRRRSRLKRGGGSRGVPLPSELAGSARAEDAWVLSDDVQEALTRFVEAYPREGQVLTLRVFMGRTTSEIAEAFSVSASTVERDLRKARVYLRAMLGDARVPSIA